MKYNLVFYNREGNKVKNIIVQATGRREAINKYLRYARPKDKVIRVEVVDDLGIHLYVLARVEIYNNDKRTIRYTIEKVKKL